MFFGVFFLAYHYYLSFVINKKSNACKKEPTKTKIIIQKQNKTIKGIIFVDHEEYG